MNKLLNKKLLNKKGFSLIGSLIGFSFLGVSTVGLATYMGNFEQVQVQYSEQSEISFQHKSLIEAVKSMIIGVKVEAKEDDNGLLTGSANDYNVHGLCKLVAGALKYNDIDSKFLCPIKIKKSDAANGTGLGFDANRWKYFLKVISNDHWTLTDNSSCGSSNGFIGDFEGPIKKCVQSTGAGGKTVYARIKVVPKNIVTNKDIESSADTILVDRLGYKVETVISIPTELTQNGITRTTHSLTRAEKLVLSSEVLDCHICQNGACSASSNNLVVARLSTSSIAVASAGTTVGSTKISDICYHADSSFEKDICNEDGGESVLSLDYVKKNILQAGTTIPPTNNGDGDNSPTNTVITSDTTQNVALSCSTHVFKCSNATQRFKNEDDFDPALRMTYGLYLDTILKSTNIDSIDFKINNKDGEGNGHEHILSALYDAGDGKARVGRSDDGLQEFDKDVWALKAGGTEITTYASIKEGSVNMCENICLHPGTYKPTIDVKFNSKRGRACTQKIDFGKNPHGIRAQCTVCHMKNCHRYGVGTFGKAQEQPVEPYDGSVPECVLNNSVSSLNNSSEIRVASSNDLDKKCIVKTSSGLKAKACGSDTTTDYASGNKKALCFVNGQSKMISGASGGLRASLNCLAPLEEAQMLGVANAKGVWTNGLLPSLSLAYNLPPASTDATMRTVKKVLTDGGLTETTKDSKKVFEIKNSANMATYFSDPLDSTVEPSSGDEIWVNIQRDASDAFLGGWPSMMKGGDWAFFYREPFDGTRFNDVDDVPVADLPSGETTNSIKRRSRPARPIFVKMAGFGIDGHHSTNETKTGTSIKALQLVHHLKYKGLRGVGQTTSRDFPYLCRDVSSSYSIQRLKDMIKVSTRKGNNLSSGQAACQNLGDEWYFMPPDSRELWAAALQAVAPNATRYSFPNPFKFADGVPFHNSSGKLSFSLAEFSSIDFNLSKNSDHHMIADKSLLRTPDAAWVNLVPAHGVTNPDIYKVSDWSPSWSAVFGSEMKSNSIFNPSIDYEEQFTKMREELVSYAGSGDRHLAGVIDKAGNILTIAEFRDALEESGESIPTHKFCAYTKSNKDIWTNMDIGYRSAFGDCRDYASRFIKRREKLTHGQAQKMVKGIRPAEILARLHRTGSYHIENTSKFCGIWRGEKKRRHAGYCMAKAYNSSTNSKALKVEAIGGDGSEVRHSMAITLTSRGAICHNSTNGCGGAYNFYNTHSQNTNNSPIARWLNGKSSATVKAACTAAISDKAVHEQTFDPGVSGVPSFTYNFDNATDSRCWSIEKLNPYVALVYTAGGVEMPDVLQITSTDAVKNAFAWDKKITPSDTSKLGLLDETAFPDLPSVLSSNCGDGDIESYWQPDSQTPRPYSSPDDCKANIAQQIAP